MTREEAIKILKAIRVYKCYPKSAGEETNEAIDMAIEALKAPTESTNTPINAPTDFISKAEVLETYSELYWFDIDCGVVSKAEVDKIYERLQSLPSADAVEVVRCKDCKWHLNGHLCKQLSQYGSIETPPSFYCGFAERRVQCQE